jgi:hypothetical protein
LSRAIVAPAETRAFYFEEIVVRLISVGLILAAGMLLGPTASAQTNEKFADLTGEIEMVRSMAQTERKAAVLQNMVFTAAESEAFWPLYNQYRGEIATVQDRLVKLIADYAATYETLTDAQAQDLLGDYLDYQADVLKVRKKYVGRFSKVLPGAQVARFYQIENKLDAVMNLTAASQIPLSQ